LRRASMKKHKWQANAKVLNAAPPRKNFRALGHESSACVHLSAVEESRSQSLTSGHLWVIDSMTMSAPMPE